MLIMAPPIMFFLWLRIWWLRCIWSKDERVSMDPWQRWHCLYQHTYYSFVRVPLLILSWIGLCFWPAHSRIDFKRGIKGKATRPSLFPRHFSFFVDNTHLVEFSYSISYEFIFSQQKWLAHSTGHTAFCCYWFGWGWLGCRIKSEVVFKS